jgi:hypothetical protein
LSLAANAPFAWALAWSAWAVPQIYIGGYATGLVAPLAITALLTNAVFALGWLATLASTAFERRFPWMRLCAFAITGVLFYLIWRTRTVWPEGLDKALWFWIGAAGSPLLLAAAFAILFITFKKQ